MTHLPSDLSPSPRTTARRSAISARAVCGNWLVWSLSATALVFSACAESKGIEVGQGGSREPDLTGGSQVASGQCESAANECGNGCCPDQSVCSESFSCIPVNDCVTNADCGSDSFCGDTLTCAPWTSNGADASCRNEVPLANLVPEVQCEWPGDTTPAFEPDSVQVLGTPMVVDFNEDGDSTTVHPSIVFLSYKGLFSQGFGTLRVIDGETCELKHSVNVGGLFETDLEAERGQGDAQFLPEISPALGDINNDGVPDIVVATREPVGAEGNRDGLIAYDLSSGSLVEMWRERSASSGDIGGVALHDLDNNEIPEVLTATGIFSALGEELDQLPIGGYEPPLVMNVEGNLEAEIITDQGVFRWSSDLRKTDEMMILENNVVVPLWVESEKESEVFVAAANLVDQRTQLPGGVDSVELVMVARGGDILVKRIDGVTIHRIEGSGQAGGPPVIADFDGDGRMEFGSPGRGAFTVYDLDCKPGADYYNPEGCTAEANADAMLWQVPIQGSESGASVFDFDGDDRAEVIYADQCFLRMYDGVTGNILFSVARSSVTQWEYPVVADVDGDSHSEIVTGSNDANGSISCPDTDPYFPSARYERTHGVRVWTDPGQLWAGSRPIWNQHTYNVTNVNDDGTIPSSFELLSSWNPSANGGPNTFRQNIQGETGASVNIPDLTVSGLAEFNCVPGGTRVGLSIELCNRGLLPLAPGEATANIRRSDNATQALGSVSVDDEGLNPGECKSLITFIERAAGEAAFDVTILGDPSNRLDECEEANNTAVIANIFCQGGPR